MTNPCLLRRCRRQTAFITKSSLRLIWTPHVSFIGANVFETQKYRKMIIFYDIADEEKRLEVARLERETETPDSVVSSSSPECIMPHAPVRFVGMYRVRYWKIRHLLQTFPKFPENFRETREKCCWHFSFNVFKISPDSLFQLHFKKWSNLFFLIFSLS